MSLESLRQRLHANAFDHEAMHGLVACYQAAGRIDAAWCVAGVLCFLKKATRAEESLYEEHRVAELPLARQPLPEDVLRRHVAHREQDLYLTCAFGLMARPVAMWRALAPPPRLRPHKRIDVTDDPSLVSRMIAYVAKVLDVPPPDVYLRPEEMGDLALMNLARDGRLQPSLVVLQSLLRGKAEPHLVFALGRAMLDLYPPHFCCVALDRSPQALERVLTACLHGAGLPVMGDTAMHDQIAREVFGRMQPAAREQLRSIAHRLVEPGRSLDVGRWMRAVELTSYRVGYLLCGDLRIAGQMISQEMAPLGTGAWISPRDKIKELVVYGISEDYFAARRAIGLDVGA